MKNTSNVAMSDFWNGEGGEKWLRFQENIENGLFHFGQEAITAAMLETGEHVLDIGCGWGNTTFEIAPRVGPFGGVKGIDISEIILEQTPSREKLATRFNIDFECADAQSYSFETKSFDVVYSRFGVMFFNDPVEAFKNIRTALKPSGRISFICWQPIEANEWIQLPLDIAEKYVPLLPRPDPEEPGGFSFGDPNRVKRILKKAGFVDIEITPFNTTFNIGKNINEAVTFLSQIGPASSAFEDPNVSVITKKMITTELHDKLVFYEKNNGVELGAAAWVVTAQTGEQPAE